MGPSMRIQFDVTHPAHVHLFRFAIASLVRDGHTVAVTARKKEMTTDLLDWYGIDHTVLSKKGTSKPALASEWLLREARGIVFARKFQPDIVVSRLNPPAIHGAVAVGAKSIVFHDSEPANQLLKIMYPFIDVLCTPVSFTPDHGDKQIRYNGFHELAYLHPNWFTPDDAVLTTYGVDPTEPYAVVRFVSMGAHHDVGYNGFSPAAKTELVSSLSNRMTVYVSNESDTDLVDAVSGTHVVPTPPAAIHTLLAGASIFVTDSDTMAAEAGLLGTPTVRLHTFGKNELGNFTRLSESGLVFSTPDEDTAIEKAVTLVSDPTTQTLWDERRETFLAECIDVTEFMLDLITSDGDVDAVSYIETAPPTS